MKQKQVRGAQVWLCAHCRSISWLVRLESKPNAVGLRGGSLGDNLGRKYDEME